MQLGDSDGDSDCNRMWDELALFVEASPPSSCYSRNRPLPQEWDPNFNPHDNPYFKRVGFKGGKGGMDIWQGRHGHLARDHKGGKGSMDIWQRMGKGGKGGNIGKGGKDHKGDTGGNIGKEGGKDHKGDKDHKGNTGDTDHKGGKDHKGWFHPWD